MADIGELMPGRRIVVVGTTGSGKTTLGRALGELLGIPHVELDSLHWNPNWEPAPTDVLRRRVLEALSGEAWVSDGNYGKVHDLTLERADTVVWLDYGLPVVLSRLFRRTSRRVATREELWSGNRETLAGVFSRDSIFLWALQTHRRRKREYRELTARPEHASRTIIHLRSPGEARRWLRAVREQVMRDRV